MFPVEKKDLEGWASRADYNQHADHYYYVTFLDRNSGGYVTSACGAIETHIDNLEETTVHGRKCLNCMHTEVAKMEIAKQFKKTKSPDPEAPAASSDWITHAIWRAKSELNNLDGVKAEIRERCADLEEIIAYLEKLEENQIKL